MSGGGGLRVEGLQKVVRGLLAIGVTVDDLKDAFSDIAARGARIAAQAAPKRSGRLAGSIRGNRARNKAVISAGYKTRVPYAGPINYGWPKRGIRPARFMQVADRQLRPYARRALERSVNHVIRKRGL